MRRVYPERLGRGRGGLGEGAELEFASTREDVAEPVAVDQWDGCEGAVAAKGDVDEVALLVNGDDVGAVSPVG